MRALHELLLPLPPTCSRRRRWLRPRSASTASGSAAPSWPASRPSSKCGSQSQSTTRAGRPSCTGSASKSAPPKPGAAAAQRPRWTGGRCTGAGKRSGGREGGPGAELPRRWRLRLQGPGGAWAVAVATWRAGRGCAGWPAGWPARPVGSLVPDGRSACERPCVAHWPAVTLALAAGRAPLWAQPHSARPRPHLEECLGALYWTHGIPVGRTP